MTDIIIKWHRHKWTSWRDRPVFNGNNYSQYKTCTVCGKKKSRYV